MSEFHFTWPDVGFVLVVALFALALFYRVNRVTTPPNEGE